MTLDKTLLGEDGKKYGGLVGNAIGSVVGTAVAGVLEGLSAFSFNPYHIPSKIRFFKSLPETKDGWVCLHDIVSLGTYIGCLSGVVYDVIKQPQEVKSYHLSVLFTNLISAAVQEAKKL